MDKTKSIVNQGLINPEVKTRELSEILGIGYHQIHFLGRKGILKKTGYGRFDLIPSIQGYIEFLRAHCFRILPYKKGVKWNSKR